MQEPLICRGKWQDDFIGQCHDLGAAMAAGLPLARSVHAAGDVNGDGFDDLIIRSYRHGGPAGQDSGKVYIMFGRDDDWPLDFNISFSRRWHS